MKKSKSKAKKIIAKEPVWKTVALWGDIKEQSITLEKVSEWIKLYVPKETKPEDIRLYFEYSEQPYYYDEVLTKVEMTLQVKEKVK